MKPTSVLLVEVVEGMVKPLVGFAVVSLVIALSHVEKLNMEKEMLYSIARAYLQLSVAGFVLEFIFSHENTGWIFLVYLFMITIAAHTAGKRAKHVPHGNYVAGVSIFIATSLTMSLLVILKAVPFSPRYVIPLTGLMVAVSMGRTGMTLRRLRDELKAEQSLIETALALGATSRQASLTQIRRALTISIAPAWDNTKTMGLVSLPGAMTGLMIGGASPLKAIQYQILVMAMMLSASTMSSILSAHLSWRFFFTRAEQLRTKVLAAAAA